MFREMKWSLAFVVSVLSACGDSDSPPPENPSDEAPNVAATEAGRVRGVEQDGVVRFLGVPYAAPPVGELRWRPPAPVEPWSDVRDASQFGLSCTQSAETEGPGSEDCLFLNVWTPEVRAEKPRPVMVYIHGGGWVRGAGRMSHLSGIENVLDGQNLAQRDDVVVVTLNYRLGSIGYLAHPAFAAENDAGSTGNYGLRDAIAALEWVHQNIREFGGDPERVLVFGTSAGGSQTCALAASPLADGLFSVASAHSSGGCDCFRTDQAKAVAEALADTVGCSAADDVAACLREVPASTLVALPSSGAIADGEVLPMCPLETFQAGGGTHAPLVFGTTAHEAMGYLDDAAKALTWDSFGQVLDNSFGAKGADVAAAYGPSKYDSAPLAWVLFIGDWIYHCPDRRVLRALGGREEPLYRFVFGGILSDERHVGMGAVHGNDVPFIFRNFGELSTTEAELNLSNTMATTWAEIAATGKPPAFWAPWDESGAFVGLGLDGVAMLIGHRDAECDVLDQVPALRDITVLPFPSAQ
ncbi:MAG: carboxylesterase family protein [Polyangiaceae bacterium]